MAILFLFSIGNGARMTNRRPARDPRTVAREIPSVLDNIFPQLVPNIVAYFNKQAVIISSCRAVPHEDFVNSTLNPAMLAELAAARAEQYFNKGTTNDWNECLNIALEKQRKHFDAILPERLYDHDRQVASQLAENIISMLVHIQSKINNQPIIFRPNIPGFHWIASGVGDYAVGNSLIELKCKKQNFGVSDFRQVLMYWVLSYIAQLENNSNDEFNNIFLVNPRLNQMLELSFDDIIKITAAGRSKKAIVEDFTTLIDSHG